MFLKIRVITFFCFFSIFYSFYSISSADHNVGPNNFVVIPSTEVIGGTDPANNVNVGKSDGGFFVIKGSDDAKGGNPEWYKTHIYWDVEGLAYTKVEPPEQGGGPRQLVSHARRMECL